MKKSLLRYLSPLLLAVPLAAQVNYGDYYPRHNFTLRLGAARPSGDLGSVFTDSPAMGFGYGYRFSRYLQIETGLETFFGAAGVRDYLHTGLGPYRIKDREYLLPFGMRAIAPLLHGRLLISAGGGGAWLKYHERVNQPGEYLRIDCPVCSSRSGWGYYGLGNVTVFLDSAQHFRVGATTRVVRGYTDGEPIGFVPGYRTSDRWLTLADEMGFSF